MKTPERGCFHKYQFKSREEARDAIRKARGKHLRIKSKQKFTASIYPCPHCGFWHTGHNGSPRRMKKDESYKRDKIVYWGEDGVEYY